MTRPTALVTGASSGIGKAFAEKLASRSHDLVIVARREHLLQELADDLTARHDVKVDVLTADLSKLDELEAVEMRARDADVVVNNAGYATRGDFTDLDISGEIDVITTNVVSLVRITHAAATQMRRRGSGRIINLSSLAAFVAPPKFATYTSTKAYILQFTAALNGELRGTGVHVTALCPGYTRTGFQDVAGLEGEGIPKFLWQEADAVAEAGLAAVERNQAVCVPGWHNKAAAGILQVTPKSLVNFLARTIGDRI